SIRRILAAIDYSGHSAQALHLAARIARRAGESECLVLHVDAEEMPEVQREAFERFTAPLDTAGIQLRPVIEESADVAKAIRRVGQEKDVDLIVMGSRGQTRSVSILLGSESEHVLMESSIPVLIAKRRGERIGLLQALLDRNFQLPEPP